MSIKLKLVLKNKKLDNQSLSNFKFENFFEDNQIQSCPINSIELNEFKGPIENSNWIIKNKLLVGKYPYYEINQLISLGFNTYVCLQPSDELDKLSSYKSKVENFYHYPIPDLKIIDDESTINYVQSIIKLIHQPSSKIYIHCMGGHGRTGVIVSLLFGYLYRMTNGEALKMTQKLHDARWINQLRSKSQSYRYRSPQTRCQINQVKRILGT